MWYIEINIRKWKLCLFFTFLKKFLIHKQVYYLVRNPLPPLDPLCVLVMVVWSSCVCYLGHRCASTTPTASPCHRHLVSLHPSLLGDRATTPNYLRICRNNLEWPLQWLNTIICVIYSVHVFINNDLSILNLNSTQWKITLSNWQRLLTFAYLSRIVK